MAEVREVWPAARQQRDWVHRLAHVLAKLPKPLQAAAHRVVREVAFGE